MRIVEWREIDHVLDAVEHGVVDAGRALELLASVRHPMADRLDLGHARNRDAGVGARHPGHDELDGVTEIAERRGAANRFAGRIANRVDRFATDSLDGSARELFVAARRNTLGVGAHELELERGRAGVEDEDVHGSSV